MGLKNRLSKMKSFLFDEEEEKESKVSKIKEKKKEKPVLTEKREVRHEVKEEDDDIEELYFENTNLELKTNDVVQSRVVKNEKEFKFPEFDDNDFLVKKEEKVEKEVRKPVETVKKVPLYQGSKRKDEIKKFRPSPIISPIYGLLDSEGNTLKKDSDAGNSYKTNNEVTFDDVRKKAYGIVEENLSDTIENLSSKTIEEAEKEMEAKEKAKVLSREDKVVKSKAKVKEVDDDDDDMILPNVDFKEIDIDEKITSKTSKKEIEEDDDEEEETKEQDLFKLIDTMYDKEGKDE